MIHAFMNMDIMAGLTTLLAVSGLIVLVLLIRRPVAKRFGAQAAYLLWAIPFARLVLPPLPEAWTLGLPKLSTAAPSPAHAETTVTFTASAQPIPAGGTPDMALTAAASPAANISPALEQAQAAASGPSIWIMLGGALLAVWAIGAIALAARSFFRHSIYMKIVHREARAPSQRLSHLTQTLAHDLGMKRVPTIGLSLISSGPMVTGLARPIILLPAWFEDDYTLREQRAAIAHELTHIKRGDLWALQLAELFVAALWFNPLAYLARRSFRSDQEAACDSDVLRAGTASPHEYGATLVKAVRLSMGERMPALAAGLPHNHEIKERLLLMTGPTPSNRKRLMGTGLTAFAGAAALMLTSTTAIAHPTPDDELDGGTTSTTRHVTVHGITLDDGNIFIDGRPVADRQFILLDDPFDGLEPTAEERQRIDAMARKASSFFDNISMPEPPVPPIPPMPDMPQLSFLSELAELRGLEELENLSLDDLDIYTNFDEDGMHIRIPEHNIDIKVDREKFEEHAEKIAEQAEAWAEKYEAEAEAWSEVHAERAEAWAEAHEARAEEWEAHFEEEFEQVFGEDFEHRMENAGEMIEKLVEACEEAKLDSDGVQVIEKTRADGRSIKAVCTTGGQKVLFADRTERLINSDARLTDKDRQKFFEKRDQRIKRHMEWREHSDVHTSETDE